MRQMNRDQAAFRAVVTRHYADGTHRDEFHGPFSTDAAARNRMSRIMNRIKWDIEEGGTRAEDWTLQGHPVIVKVTGHTEFSSSWAPTDKRRADTLPARSTVPTEVSA